LSTQEQNYDLPAWTGLYIYQQPAGLLALQSGYDFQDQNQQCKNSLCWDLVEFKNMNILIFYEDKKTPKFTHAI
jgi:hypothetical protein